MRPHLFRLGLLLVLWNATAFCSDAADQTQPKSKDQPHVDVLVVVGAGGTPEYAEQFGQWADRWETISQQADRTVVRIEGQEGGREPVDQLREALRRLSEQPSEKALWIVLIGHGTWDGKTANFNLVGPDMSAAALNESLAGIDRPIVVVNCSSSSAPFIDRVSGPRRVIVTATKSGSEQNYARFGDFFSAAIASPNADVDHDDAVSVREAFLKASSDVERFYKEQGRLATEHALLDDNADRKGSDDTLVAGKSQAKDNAEVDGAFAARLTLPVPGNHVRLTEQQQKKRDQLESRLTELQQNAAGDSDTLRQQAMPILVELAKLYAEAEAAVKTDGKD